MRICVISPDDIDSEGWGGVHTHTRLLCGLLKRQDHEVTLVTYGTDSASKVYEGVLVVYTGAGESPCPGRKWRELATETFQRLHSEKAFDCVFSEGYSAEALPRKGIPCLLAFVHNFHLVHFYNNFTEVDGIRPLLNYTALTIPKLLFRMFRYEILFLKRAHYVLSASEFNAGLLRSFYRISADKLRVVRNWVETEEFRPDLQRRETLRKSMGISPLTKVFAMAGSLWRPKGFHVAIKAFAFLEDQLPDSLLLIAGGGRDEGKLRSLAGKRTFTKERIRFLGVLGREALKDLYCGSDIFLMPSLLSETLPYSLLEAMSSGLPAIASNIGGSREALGQSGILVPPGDCQALAAEMKSLAWDTRKMEKFSRMARQRVLQYFSEEMAGLKISQILKVATGDKSGQ